MRDYRRRRCCRGDGVEVEAVAAKEWGDVRRVRIALRRKKTLQPQTVLGCARCSHLSYVRCQSDTEDKRTARFAGFHARCVPLKTTVARSRANTGNERGRPRRLREAARRRCPVHGGCRAGVRGDRKDGAPSRLSSAPEAGGGVRARRHVAEGARPLWVRGELIYAYQ